MSTESQNEKPGYTPSQDSGAQPLSWFSPRFFLYLWGMAVATYIVLVQLPARFDLAMDPKSCADWKGWIPVGVLSLFVLAAFFPTTIPQLAALVEAPGNLAGKIKDAIAPKTPK